MLVAVGMCLDLTVVFDCRRLTVMCDVVADTICLGFLVPLKRAQMAGRLVECFCAVDLVDIVIVMMMMMEMKGLSVRSSIDSDLPEFVRVDRMGYLKNI